MLQRIQSQVLVFQADHACGGMLTEAEAAVLKEGIRDCRIVRVEGAPHLVHWSAAVCILAGTN